MGTGKKGGDQKGLLWRLPEVTSRELGKIGPAFGIGVGCGAGAGVGFFGGALGSSNSSSNSMDGLRRSSNLEQARAYTSSPLRALRPKISPSRSRSLHTSQPLSAPVANRPLSPHLPLKKPQLSATFSISHRIFGVALGAAIISIPLATKFSHMFDV